MFTAVSNFILLNYLPDFFILARLLKLIESLFIYTYILLEEKCIFIIGIKKCKLSKNNKAYNINTQINNNSNKDILLGGNNKYSHFT